MSINICILYIHLLIVINISIYSFWSVSLAFTICLVFRTKTDEWKQTSRSAVATPLSPSLSTLSLFALSSLSVRASALRRLVSSRQMIFGFLYKSCALSFIFFTLSHLSANCKQSLAYKSSYTIDDVCICICMSVQRIHR